MCTISTTTTKNTQKVKGGRLDVEESSCKSVAYQIPIWHSGHVLRKFHAGVALSFPKRNNHSLSCFVIPLLHNSFFFFHSSRSLRSSLSRESHWHDNVSHDVHPGWLLTLRQKYRMTTTMLEDDVCWWVSQYFDGGSIRIVFQGLI